MNFKVAKFMLAGALGGTIGGNALGSYMHSDNLPFFMLLGLTIGLIFGLAVSIYFRRR